jgi:hypothetical protein
MLQTASAFSSALVGIHNELVRYIFFSWCLNDTVIIEAICCQGEMQNKNNDVLVLGCKSLTSPGNLNLLGLC